MTQLISNISIQDLEDKSLDLLSKTYVQLGQHNITAEDKVILAKTLAADLKRFYSKFYWNDVEESFYLGIRQPVKDSNTFIHINVPTIIKWLKTHKQRIWDDIYRAEVLGQDKNLLPYYREQKLLK